ncbi:AAA family ATPase [Cumulibacter manganitolerans]|uniref:AAA family ATPase n=1 Tax=Cumulibacter manganitolerans TaxID=1884992 RepID=UPI001296C192|nr:AAA family ATPase [Cumulibacter manganitolerans]
MAAPSRASWPPDADRVFAAFCDAGLWPGLGISSAADLPKAGIVRADLVTRDALLRLPRTAGKRADRLLSGWLGAQPVYDVVRLLVPAGIPARAAQAVLEDVGDDAVRLIENDPWRIVGVRGIDVASADEVARNELGSMDRQDPRRARAVVTEALRAEAADGHTEAPLEDVLDAVRAAGITDSEAAIAAAVDDDLVVRRTAELIALKEYADAEDSIAADVARIAASAKKWGRSDSLKDAVAGLDEKQAAAVALVMTEGVSVLTGGPGTGKSRTVRAVVDLARVHDKEVALAAPTGRAAKRLGELAGSEGVTVHRLLGAQGRDGGFTRGWDDPIPASIIVVDESSMLDVLLAAALLDAVEDGAHVLVVGDVAQLPSIGPGRVLADLICSGVVPVTELTTLYRQAEGGQIAALAAEVRQGTLPVVDDPTREVVVVGARGSAEAAHRTVQLVTDSIPRVFGLDAADIQVVTPVHRGPAGTKELNLALKARLNPGRGAVSGFDLGDRVVATANHLDAAPFGYANGEVGTVVGTGDKSLTVEFSSGIAEISGKALGDLLHGWAITVHRAQGSEWPAVVAVVPPEAGRLLVRALVYTAFTRAQRHLSIVHGSGPALAYAVREKAARPRRTSLVDRLRTRVERTARGPGRRTRA